ncbi:hypothetical protein [Clostridium sp. YIM B02555]|uniref:hypothetical protein n=1 Tax=Clostridium sp. YIM B02555 TaxID=2911968 RepID=UPI001EED3D61|nr:hypothetical protein [Clostridium sp. YIM B02555]
MYKIVRETYSKYNFQEIDIGKIDSDNPKFIIYKVNVYKEIIKDITKELENEKDEQNLEKLLKKLSYILKYKSLILTKLIEGIENNKIIIKVDIQGQLKKSNETDSEEFFVGIKNKILGSLLFQKDTITRYYYAVRKIPFIYNNNYEWQHISENYYQYFEEYILLYNNIFIEYKSLSHTYILKSPQGENFGTKNDLMNILSFLFGRPIFCYTPNQSYNEKLEKIYCECELLDLLRLRNNKLFSKENNCESYSSICPILKGDHIHRIHKIPEMDHAEVLELYSAALKQVEPLPKCVFLYRVVEYAINEHYNKLFASATTDVSKAIEYYLEEALKHTFIPLYYIDTGRYYSFEEDKVVKVDKAKLKNIIITLKMEISKIKTEWSMNVYLSTKDIGNIIYSNGRCATAHGHTGKNGKYNARYDYQYNYFHINNVNIMLELMARYIVELFNPQLKNLIVKERKPYILDNQFYFRE